jgi:hypothetical protein
MAPTAVFAALKPRFRKFMASRFTVTVRARSCTSLAHAFAQTPGRSDLPGVDLRRKSLSFIGFFLQVTREPVRPMSSVGSARSPF